jgi:glycosyltransferase 2 family protein
MLYSYLKRVMTWRRLMGLGFSLTLMAIVLARLDLAQLRILLVQMKWGWALAAGGVFGAACLLSSLRWHLMLQLRLPNPPMGGVLRAGLAGHFLNTLLMGPAVGDIAKSVFYSRWHGRAAPEVMAACWLDRLVAGVGSGVFALIVLPLVDWPALPAWSWNFSLRWWHVLVGAVLASVVVVLARSSWSGKAFLSESLQGWCRGVKQLLKTPVYGGIAVMMGLLVQVNLSGVLMVNLLAVTQTEVPWSQLLWTFPVISLLTALPITMAGAGVREGAALVLLGWFGVPAADAVAAALLTLAWNLAWAGAGAGVLAWEEYRSAQQQIAARLSRP